MIALYNRIIAWLFSLLLLVFPSLLKYSPPLDVNASVASVITAIKTRDINTIEAFMCKNIKDNVPNLHAEIERLIDAIEGTITSTSSESGDGFYGSSGGKKIDQKNSYSRINTSTTTYRLTIVWEVYNNFSIEERGIRAVDLFIPASDTEPEKVFAEISATNGIWSMHS